MISAKDSAALKRLAGRRTKAELKALFALVRSHDDRTLLAAISPPKPLKIVARGDSLLAEVDAILKPLMARSSEKAELLLEHLGQSGAPRGLSAALKKLRAANFTEAQIRNGAKSLMTHLSRNFDGRETVV